MNRLPLLIAVCLLPLIALLAQSPAGDTSPSDAGYDVGRRVMVRDVVARADSGDAKAIYYLAYLHDIGYDSIPVDTLRSTELYTLAAEKGYAPAQNYLGFRYYRGEGVPRDVARGLDWLEKAAMQGDPKAANNLGWLLMEGEGVEHDYGKAAFWLRSAADAGLPAGQAQLADLLRTGRGLPTDTIEAERLYTLAVEGGLRDAEAKLMAMMRNAWRSLTPQEALTRGFSYYTRRAPSAGVTLFEQVVDDTPQFPTDTLQTAVRARALALLGDAYTRAQGVAYDHDRSLQLFTEAALLGDPSAMFIIGELLEIFPDALTGIQLPPQLIPSELHPADTPMPADGILPSDPGWWLSRAAEAGVTDAATANSRLLSPL